MYEIGLLTNVLLQNLIPLFGLLGIALVPIIVYFETRPRLEVLIGNQTKTIEVKRNELVPNLLITLKCKKSLFHRERTVLVSETVFCFPSEFNIIDVKQPIDFAQISPGRLRGCPQSFSWALFLPPDEDYSIRPKGVYMRPIAFRAPSEKGTFTIYYMMKAKVDATELGIISLFHRDKKHTLEGNLSITVA